MNELSITKKYPAEQYNLLGNTDVIVEVPDIKSPVIQSIRLNPDPKKGDVYIQQRAAKEYTASPPAWTRSSGTSRSCGLTGRTSNIWLP